MTAPPSISVVIALYNKGPFIAATLSSALTQRLAALEIIVVDDGSSDGGADIVEQCKDTRVRLLRQANGGVSRARNAGVAAARGDWIAFLDADDLWHPDYLHAMARLMHEHPSVDAVASAYRSVSVEQVQQGDGFLPINAVPREPAALIDDLPSRWLEGTCFFTSSVLVRSTTLAALQPCFPPGEHAGEDLDLWVRVGERGSIALSPEPLVLRLWVAGSLSSAVVAAHEPAYLLRMESRARAGQMPARLRQPTLRFVNDARVTLARELISSRRRGQALPLLCRAWRHASPRRWALSLLMLVLPGSAVQQFQNWRTRRRMIL